MGDVRARRKRVRRGGRRVGPARDRRDDVAAGERRVAKFRHERGLGHATLRTAAALGVLNLGMEFDTSLRLPPGGHSELYFLIAVAGIGPGAWFGFNLGLRERRR